MLRLACWVHLLPLWSGVPLGVDAQGDVIPTPDPDVGLEPVGGEPPPEELIGGTVAPPPEPPRVFDFATEMNLPGHEAIESVIRAQLYIKGPIDARLLGTLASACQAAVSRVCGAVPNPVIMDTPTQDIRTYGQRKIGFDMKFYLLIPWAGGRMCMDAFFMASHGASEAPFDEGQRPEPPFRTLLYWEFMQYRELAPLAPGLQNQWLIDLDNITCDYEDTISIPMVNRSVYELGATTTVPPVGVSTTPWPQACLDGQDAPFWDPSFGEPEDFGTSCRLAASACMCATIQGCRWGYHVSGGYRCQSGWGGATCMHCPKQSICPADNPDLCPLAMNPCACAGQAAACMWDVGIGRCREKLAPWEGTSCELCSRQPQCPGPAVTRMRPEQLDVMGMPEVGWHVNVTFDKEVQLGNVGFYTRLACRAADGSGESEFELDKSRMFIVNTSVLCIDVRGLDNDRMNDCDVVIGENTVIDEFLSGNDETSNMLWVTIEDMVSPELTDFIPVNSPEPVPMEEITSITLIFNERVRFSQFADNLPVQLWVLGGHWEGGTQGVADAVIQEYTLDADTATVNGNRITIAIGNVLQLDRMYSLSLPYGVITDMTGNLLPEMPVGFYAFRTDVDLGSVTAQPEEEDITDMLPPNVLEYTIAGLCGAIFIGIVTAIACRIRSLRPKIEPWQGNKAMPGNDVGVEIPYPEQSALGKEVKTLGLYRGASAVMTIQTNPLGDTVSSFMDPESGLSPKSALRASVTNAWQEQGKSRTAWSYGSPRGSDRGSHGGSAEPSPRSSMAPCPGSPTSVGSPWSTRKDPRVFSTSATGFRESVGAKERDSLDSSPGRRRQRSAPDDMDDMSPTSYNAGSSSGGPSLNNSLAVPSSLGGSPTKPRARSVSPSPNAMSPTTSPRLRDSMGASRASWASQTATSFRDSLRNAGRPGSPGSPGSPSRRRSLEAIASRLKSPRSPHGRHSLDASLDASAGVSPRGVRPQVHGNTLW